MLTIENAAQLKELGQVRHGWITQVAWSPDGKVLAVACGQGVAMYVNGFGGAPTYTLPHPAPAKSVAFHPKKPLIATGCKDSLVRLWTTPDKAIKLRGHTDSVNSVAFHPSDDVLASGGSDRELILWRTDPPYEETTSFLKHTDEISSLAISKNYGFATGSWDKTIYLSLNDVVFPHDDWVREICFSPRTEILASASKDGHVRLWQLKTSGEPAHQAVIAAHGGGADSIAFYPDETLLATGGRDNLIRLWDVQKVLGAGKAEMQDAIATLQGHNKPVLSLAFNPAGTMLVSGSGDNTVRLWGL